MEQVQAPEVRQVRQRLQRLQVFDAVAAEVEGLEHRTAGEGAQTARDPVVAHLQLWEGGEQACQRWLLKD